MEILSVLFTYLEKENLNPREYDNYLSALCPFHRDTQNSLLIYETYYTCKSCGVKGSTKDLLAKLSGSDREFHRIEGDILLYEAKQYNKYLLNNKELLEYLERERGISRNVIAKYYIGFDHHFITIPIFNDKGEVINIRKYKPKDTYKMRGLRGKNRPYVFPVANLQVNEPIYLFEGEGDCLTALSLGLNGVTITGGALTKFPRQLIKYIVQKTIFICYDVDKAGRLGAEEVGKQLLEAGASEVSIIELPLKGGEDGKDFTDWVVFHNGTLQEFKALPTRKVSKVETGGAIETLDVSEIANPKLIGGTIRIEAQVISFNSVPFFIPQKVKVGCEQDGKKCGRCLLTQHNLADELVLGSAEEVLEFVDINNSQLPNAIKRVLGVPGGCSSFWFTTTENATMYEMMVMPIVSQHTRDFERSLQPFICYSKKRMSPNREYELTGKVVKIPKNQRASFIVNEYKRLNRMENMLPEPAYTFAKLKDIYEDLETITGIYGRKQMLLGMLLQMFLPLYFELSGQRFNGFSDALIVGDTREGKSKALEALMTHFGVGEFVTAEHASYAGLVGGVEKGVGGNHFVKWGRYPANDGGFLALDECSGLVELVPRLSGLRSSGVAEVTKITSERANARVRSVWLSNPVGNKMVADFGGNGVNLIRKLIKAPEDIARFNFIMVIGADEVPVHYKIEAPLLSQNRKVKVLIKENAQQQIYWMWNLKPEQIKFTDEDCLREAGKYLINSYNCDFPIFNPSETIIKLARLSIALAGILGNVEEGCLIVDPEHIETIRKWYDTIYTSKYFNLKQYVIKFNNKNKVSYDVIEEVLNLLEANGILAVDFKRVMEEVEELDDKYLRQSLGIDIASIDMFMAGLLQLGLLKYNGRKYEKTPRCVKVLERILFDLERERKRELIQF